MNTPLLQVNHLHTEFHTPGGVVKAVRDVCFHVNAGETVGLVGESGSGKSVTSLSLMRLIPNPPGRITGGEVLLNNQDILKLSESEMSKVRGKRISMVFQDPFSCLNPTMTLGMQVMEPLLLHTKSTRSAAKARVIELFRAVRIPLPEIRFKQYPHEISGGQRQRVMIAIAFACNPELLIADEPTTALDVTVQAQVLSVMKELQAQTNTGIILITHDLGVVAEVCDRVLVMYAGTIVESGSVSQIFNSPQHPYTQALLQSLPDLHGKRLARLATITGQPPDLSKLGTGCPFYARCTQREEACVLQEPSMRTNAVGQMARCIHIKAGDNL